SGCWESGGINCLKRRFGRKRSSLPQKRESREKKNWIPVSTGIRTTKPIKAQSKQELHHEAREEHEGFTRIFSELRGLRALRGPGAINVTSIDYCLLRLRSNASIN